MGQYLSATIVTTAETSSSITRQLQITYHSTGAVTDSTNLFTVTGDWTAYSDSRPISIPYGGGSQVLYTSSATFSKLYGTTQTKTWSASFSGVDYWGYTIYGSGYGNVPARPWS